MTRKQDSWLEACSLPHVLDAALFVLISECLCGWGARGNGRPGLSRFERLTLTLALARGLSAISLPSGGLDPGIVAGALASLPLPESATGPDVSTLTAVVTPLLLAFRASSLKNAAAILAASKCRIGTSRGLFAHLQRLPGFSRLNPVWHHRVVNLWRALCVFEPADGKRLRVVMDDEVRCFLEKQAPKRAWKKSLLHARKPSGPRIRGSLAQRPLLAGVDIEMHLHRTGPVESK